MRDDIKRRRENMLTRREKQIRDVYIQALDEYFDEEMWTFPGTAVHGHATATAAMMGYVLRNEIEEEW